MDTWRRLGEGPHSNNALDFIIKCSTTSLALDPRHSWNWECSAPPERSQNGNRRNGTKKPVDEMGVNRLNEAAAQLVRITWGVVSSVSYDYMYAVYSTLTNSSRWCIHKAYQADVSMDFHTRLEKPPKGKFYASVSSIVSFLYLQKLTSESSFSKW